MTKGRYIIFDTTLMMDSAVDLIASDLGITSEEVAPLNYVEYLDAEGGENIPNAMGFPLRWDRYLDAFDDNNITYNIYN